MEYRGIPRAYAVEFATLGLLVEAPQHGYALRTQLREGLGALWRIASSQLYSVLHRLARREWIEGQDTSSTARPARTVYRITPEGERAFWSWVTSPVRHLRDVRVEFMAKLYILRRLAPGRVSALVDTEIAALRQLEANLGAREAIESDDLVFGRLALSFRRSQVAGTLRWLEEHREALAAETPNREEIQ